MIRSVFLWLRLHAHFSKFLLVGCLNTLIDFILFFIFANLVGLHAVQASIISTGITMCVSFYLNHRFVFRSAKKKRHTAIQFLSVTIFNVWVVQSSVIYVVVHALQNNSFFMSHLWTLNLTAKLFGVGVSFILNFIMYRYIFRQVKQEEAPVL